MMFPGTGTAVATVLRKIGPTGVVVLRRPGLAALTATTVFRRLVLTAGMGFHGLGPAVTVPTMAGTGFCRALSTPMEAAGAVLRTLTAPVVSRLQDYCADYGWVSPGRGQSLPAGVPSRPCRPGLYPPMYTLAMKVRGQDLRAVQREQKEQGKCELRIQFRET